MQIAKIQKDRAIEIEQRVFQVAEDYGLEIEEELDDVGVKYLGTYVNARTSKEGPKLRIDFDSQNFFKMSEERQKRTILHEIIHIKQFNNSLSDWAREEFDISEDAAEKLDGTIWEDVRSIEGETELLLSNFFPDQDSSYPYAQSSKEREFEDIDLDSEFDSTEEDLEDIIDEYKIEDESSFEDGVYFEEGEFDGVDYSVAVLGGSEEEARERVDEYLVEEADSMYKDSPYSGEGISMEYEQAEALQGLV